MASGNKTEQAYGKNSAKRRLRWAEVHQRAFGRQKTGRRIFERYAKGRDIETALLQSANIEFAIEPLCEPIEGCT
jgi:hypothetical protein